MGTFLGHILSGTFFFIYGLLYIVKDALNSCTLCIWCTTGTRNERRTAGRTSGSLLLDSGGDIPYDNSSGGDDDGEAETLFYCRASTPNGGRCNELHVAHKSETDGQQCNGNRNTYQRYTNGNTNVGKTMPSCCPKCRYFANSVVIEGILKIVCSLIGALGEVWWGGWYLISPRTGNFTNMNNWQHATMFTFFAVSGVADIACHTCFKTRSTPHAERLFLSLAFFGEGLLFYFHLHGRSDLDVTIHTLLLLAIFVGAFGSGLEPWCYPAAPGIRRLWVAAVTLQGTWFWQTAFVLYNPWTHGLPEPWDDTEHSTIMMLTTTFTWHILAVIILIVIVNLVVQNCLRLRKVRSGLI